MREPIIAIAAAIVPVPPPSLVMNVPPIRRPSEKHDGDDPIDDVIKSPELREVGNDPQEFRIRRLVPHARRPRGPEEKSHDGVKPKKNAEAQTG